MSDDTRQAGMSEEQAARQLCSRMENAAGNMARGFAGELAEAGLMLVGAQTIRALLTQVETLVSQLNRVTPADPYAEDEKPARQRKPRAEGGHRHKFDAAGRCAITGCTHVKQAGRGRPPTAERPSAEARTVPMSIPEIPSRPTIGRGADDFAGGAFGSSGTGDRR